MRTPKRLPPRQKRPEPATDQHDALRKIGAVLANVTVITGLLVAFGWKRSATQATALGIESNILGMSNADYLLRSIAPVFTLLAVVVVAGLAWLWLEPRLRPVVVGRRLATGWLAWSWLIMPLLVVGFGYVWPVASFYAFPLSVGGGILLSCYVIESTGRRGWDWPKVRLFAVAAGVLTLFWAALNYAHVDGQRLADEFEPALAPAVTVFSQERMHITGVREEPLDGDKSRYRYRYSGLRLLENTGGKYFLVTDAWTRSDGVVVVLRDDATTRLEFSR